MSTVIVAASLASCTTPSSQATAEEKFANMRPEFREFIKCGYMTAKAIVAKKQDAAPEFVRDVAATTCEPERVALAWKIDKAYSERATRQGVLLSADDKFQKAVSSGAVSAF